MLNIDIKKLNQDAKIPQNMSDHAAGYDIYSCLDKPVVIKPGKLALIPTGFAMSIPRNYEAQIRPRSGLAVKHMIGVLNSPGTIDSDYRGEVKVILFNFGEESFEVNNHERIAQMVIAKHETVKFTLKSELDSTARDAGGFGSTSK